MKERIWRLTSNPLLAASLVVAAGALVRFHGITRQGLFGSDTVYYTNIAKSWAEGHPIFQIGPRNFVFRPAAFFLDAAVIRLLGFEDYSIKALNAVVDTATVGLVFLIAALISRGRLWPAAAAATIYALLPAAVWFARVELTHALGAFLVSLAALSFLRHLHSPELPRRIAWLVLSGTAVGLAALTHEDLAFVGVGLLLVLGLDALAHGREGLRRNVMAAIAFVLPYGLLCLPIVLANRVLLRTVLRDAARGPEESRGYLARVGVTLWNGVLGNGSPPLLYLFFAVACATLVALIYRRSPAALDAPTLGLLTAILVPIVYMTLYGLCFAALLPRVLLPVFPLVIVATTTGFFAAIDRLRPQAAPAATLVLALWVVLANLDHFGRYEQGHYAKEFVPAPLIRKLDLGSGLESLRSKAFRRSWARSVFDALNGRVGDKARLLVASSLMYPYPGRRELQVGYYFGDDVIYIIDHTEPLDQLIAERHIEFVLLSDYRADRRVLEWRTQERYLYAGRWSVSLPFQLGASYGFAAGEYSMEKEYFFVTGYLERRGARRLSGSDLFSCEGRGASDQAQAPWGGLPANVVIYRLPPTF